MDVLAPARIVLLASATMHIMHTLLEYTVRVYYTMDTTLVGSIYSTRVVVCMLCIICIRRRSTLLASMHSSSSSMRTLVLILLSSSMYSYYE